MILLPEPLTSQQLLNLMLLLSSTGKAFWQTPGLNLSLNVGAIFCKKTILSDTLPELIASEIQELLDVLLKLIFMP